MFARSRRRREKPTAITGTRRAARIALSLALAAGGTLPGSAAAGLLLTEIHYNGPAAGSDPDEFLELSNASGIAIGLDGYRFDTGVSFLFDGGIRLGPSESLVIARDSAEFRRSFPGFTGLLFDYRGALSNAGETLTLSNPAGSPLWSVAYDDSAPWPDSADGGGDSLQLLPGAGDLENAGNWRAAVPTPGQWPATPRGPQPVALSPPLTLMLAGLAILAIFRRQGAQRCTPVTG